MAVINFKQHTLKCGPRPSEKVELGPLKKADPMPKFTILAKNPFLINSSMLISNMISVSSNSFNIKLCILTNCPRPATLLKKRLWCKCFSVNFAKF